MLAHYADSFILYANLCMPDFITEVKTTAGDMHLGGEDFFYLAVDFCTQDFVYLVLTSAYRTSFLR